MNIKNVIAGISIAAALPVCSAAEVAFTALSAPDQPSRIALAHPLLKVDQGSLSPGDFDGAVHRNFPQIIEQNFARLGVAGTKRVMDNLSEKELSDLAQLYTSANVDSGHTGQLLPILATRLDNARLLRLSQHFGANPVYEALLNHAPAAAADFAQTANFAHLAPIPHAATVGLPVHPTLCDPLGCGRHETMVGTGIGGMLHLTPYEIYLDFRTAPVGNLAVSGALFETTIVVGSVAFASYQTGYSIGGYLAPVIETYAPNLWDAIGGTLAGVVANFNAAASQISQGNIEMGMGSMFGVSSSQASDFGSMGGDFGAASSWEAADYSAGGGGCVVNCRFYTH